MFDGLYHISPVAFILIPRLPGAFSTTRAVHICEGRWLSCCPGSVAEHWLLKSEVSWVRLLAAASLFIFLYFCLITCRFLQATVLCHVCWNRSISPYLTFILISRPYPLRNDLVNQIKFCGASVHFYDSVTQHSKQLCKEVLHSTLIGPYHSWVISPRN